MPDTWSPVWVTCALAPEKASVVRLDVFTVDVSRLEVEVTMCPSAPQSRRVGFAVARLTAPTNKAESGGLGSGFRSGGGLTQSENPGCLFDD